ncbi:MAG TPA: D-alanyl-D-alanine carboxypeptidase [Rhodospirillaceae bacterium]|nr:D-alanyl-D-alanine carboxypeptidase [Rhodospirillaceae bacterium]
MHRALPIAAIALSLGAFPAYARYASLVVDADSGEVLHSVNADSRNYPASLTKMMTLYLLFDELDAGRVHLTDHMPVSAHAAAQAPSKLGLAAGQTLEVEDAVLGLVTKSANDAAVTVAEFLGGSEPSFAERMTRKARELGMTQTQFRNASGLPNLGQVSSARDMATLARALIHNHAKEYHYFATRTFSYNGNLMTTHNHLMEHYQGADGIKTGFIAASGFNLVASAKRNGRRLIGVVFGGQSAAARDRQMAKLLDAGFLRTPGSSGVDMAEMPEQKDETEVNTENPTELKAVLKAMQAGKQRKLVATQPKPARQPHKMDDDDETAGDREDDNWGIQLGAFSKQAKAQQVAQTAVNRLGTLVSDGEISITHSKKGRHHGYRARIIGLAEEDAHQACRRLVKAHQTCKAFDASP